MSTALAFFLWFIGIVLVIVTIAGVCLGLYDEIQKRRRS